MLIGAVIINYEDFRTYPVEWYFTELKRLRIELKKLTGYGYDNSHFFVKNIYGELFAFSVYTNASKSSSSGDINMESIARGGIVGKKFELNIYNSSGGTALYSGEFKPIEGKPIPDKIVEEAEEHMEKWTQGEIRCSDCKKWINYKENSGHRYFAGIYCPQCWIGDTGHNKGRGGWYEVEKRETYE